MEIRPLRHVAALARRLSYKDAAMDLGLTQPALTRSIQVTEERFSLKLFDRDRSGVRLTSAGRSFLKRAELLLREADDFQRTAQRISDGSEGEIAFGMAPLAAKACLPELVNELLAESPNLKVSIPVREANALLPLLIAEELEFIICTEDQIPSSSPVRSVRLGSFSPSFIVRAGHPLLTKRNTDATEFPLIASSPYRPGDGPYGTLGIDARRGPQLVIEDNEALARLAQTSDVIWFSSSLAAPNEISSGVLVELPRPRDCGKSMFHIAMYCLDRRTESPAMIRAIHHIKGILGRWADTLKRRGV